MLPEGGLSQKESRSTPECYRRTFVIYGADVRWDSDELFPGLSAGAETCKRIRSAYALFNPQLDSIVVSPTMPPKGWRPFKTAEAAKWIPRPRFYEAMVEELCTLGVHRDRIHTPDYEDRVWGSLEETEMAVRQIRHFGLPKNVIVVSSAYHVPRLKLCWRAVGGDELIVLFYHVPYRNLRAAAYEFLKYPAYWCSLYEHLYFRDQFA